MEEGTRRRTSKRSTNQNNNGSTDDVKIWNPFGDEEDPSLMNHAQAPAAGNSSPIQGDDRMAPNISKGGTIRGYNPFVGTPPENRPPSLMIPRMRLSLLTKISETFLKSIQEEVESLQAALASPVPSSTPSEGAGTANGETKSAIIKSAPSTPSNGDPTRPRVHLHQAKKPSTLSLSSPTLGNSSPKANELAPPSKGASSELEKLDQEIERLLKLKQEKAKQRSVGNGNEKEPLSPPTSPTPPQRRNAPKPPPRERRPAQPVPSPRGPSPVSPRPYHRAGSAGAVPTYSHTSRVLPPPSRNQLNRPEIADTWGPTELCSTRNFELEWKRQAKALRKEYARISGKKGDLKQIEAMEKNQESPPSVFLNIGGKSLQEVKVYADEQEGVNKEGSAPVLPTEKTMEPPTLVMPTSPRLRRTISLKGILKMRGGTKIEENNDKKKSPLTGGSMLASLKKDRVDHNNNNKKTGNEKAAPLSGPRGESDLEAFKREWKERTQKKKQQPPSPQEKEPQPLKESDASTIDTNHKSKQRKHVLPPINLSAMARLRDENGEDEQNGLDGDAQNRTSMMDLPDRLLQKIFLLLTPLSLVAVSLTSKRCNQVAGNPIIWRILHLRTWGPYTILHFNKDGLTWHEEMRSAQWKELCVVRELSDRPPTLLTQIPYKEEKIFVQIAERLTLWMSPEGKLLKANVLGSVSVRCQLNGNPICSVYSCLHPPSSQNGKKNEEVSLELEDVTLHPIVDKDSYAENKSIVFVPPDDIQVEVMKYRIHDKSVFEVPFRIKSLTRENPKTKTMELAISVSSLFPRGMKARYVVISTPIPRYALATGRKIPVQVTTGHAKTDFQTGQLIWIIKRFSGNKRHLLNAEFFQGVESFTRGPIRIEWMKLNLKASPFDIRWVQVTDENDNPCPSIQKWIRYALKPGQYQVI